ncbi:MAG: hypothetical protein A2556_00600 [Candidatus Vogelbacteria bacterium RIFOXYD2_FULL_44_9]|uniref:Uncharacterized protein n=1 Tax=Candidatus Vogelbacteria bacterium RIFOXYD2_FULL_44_9 TaxID=1802441 RepID=A0A1G2QPH3_9BACT|nr:MAG: hypothetical protein A2556_00600 [Candidatus Vogelbacteria bacterium RIFOXYD2_FULL_44_9]
MTNNLSQKQIDRLWGEDGPYSQANLRKEVRILDDRVSRTFLIVEVDINPTTYKIVRKNRHKKEFKDDQRVQQLLDHSENREPYSGYVSMSFEREYTDESAVYSAEAVLSDVQKTIIKMHKFVMDNYAVAPAKSLKTKINNRARTEILEERRRIEKEIVDLLEECGSDFDLADVKEAVYSETETDDMQQIIAMFDTGEPDGPDLSTIIETVTDAWNYFPHEALGGQCPAEIV